MDPTVRTIRVTWSFSNGLGSCRCAKPRLEVLKVEVGAVVWTHVAGDCADVSKRACIVPDLTPDERYRVRMKVVCDDLPDGPVSSDWTYSDKDLLTQPACAEIPINPFLPPNMQPPPCVPRERTPAGAPSDFRVSQIGDGFGVLTWKPGSV